MPGQSFCLRRVPIAVAVGFMIAISASPGLALPPKKVRPKPAAKAPLQALEPPKELKPVPADASDEVRALMELYRPRNELIRRAPTVERELLTARSKWMKHVQNCRQLQAATETASSNLSTAQVNLAASLIADRAQVAAYISQLQSQIAGNQRRYQEESALVASAAREMAPFQQQWNMLFEEANSIRRG